MPDESADLYDEPMTDQDPRESKSTDKKEEEHEYETFLAPKSAWGGKSIEIGEEYMFKVAAIHDSEVQLQYSAEPTHKEGSEHSDQMASDEHDGLYD